MSKKISASYEARIKNAKDLVIAVTGYDQYNPSAEELKAENFRTFINEAEVAVTTLKEAKGNVSTFKKQTRKDFALMVKRSRDIRILIAEFKGTSSSEYEQVNSIVRVITGENIAKHSKKKAKVKTLLKEGNPEPATSSVSRLDHKTRLGNFRLLIGTLKSFGFYVPADTRYTIVALETMRDELTVILENSAEKNTALVNAKSSVLKLFDDVNGITDRSRRAKLIVKRQYGFSSPEFKALANKKY